MLDTLTKVIPWLQTYPTWLQTILAAWIVATGVLVALLLIIPRTTPQQHDSQTLTTPTVKKEPENSAQSGNSRTYEQQTKGDNSPAVAGVEGDVNITIEQRRNAK
jgi:hypothetical protein